MLGIVWLGESVNTHESLGIVLCVLATLTLAGKCTEPAAARVYPSDATATGKGEP